MIKTFVHSVSMVLLLAATVPGATVAQSNPDANSLLGSWHSEGIGRCPSTKNPGRPRMSPTTFNFTSVNVDNSFAGNFSIGCNGPSGTFDGTRSVAKLNGSQVVVELGYAGGGKYTYTFATAGGAGEMVTPSGDHNATIFEHGK